MIDDIIAQAQRNRAFSLSLSDKRKAIDLTGKEHPYIRQIVKKLETANARYSKIVARDYGSDNTRQFVERVEYLAGFFGYDDRNFEQAFKSAQHHVRILQSKLLEARLEGEEALDKFEKKQSAILLEIASDTQDYKRLDGEVEQIRQAGNRMALLATEVTPDDEQDYAMMRIDRLQRRTLLERTQLEQNIRTQDWDAKEYMTEAFENHRRIFFFRHTHICLAERAVASYSKQFDAMDIIHSATVHQNEIIGALPDAVEAIQETWKCVDKLLVQSSSNVAEAIESPPDCYELFGSRSKKSESLGDRFEESYQRKLHEGNSRMNDWLKNGKR